MDADAQLGVAAAVDWNLDERGAVRARFREVVQALDAAVWDSVERRDRRGVEPERSAEERLELLALELFGLGE